MPDKELNILRLSLRRVAEVANKQGAGSTFRRTWRRDCAARLEHAVRRSDRLDGGDRPTSSACSTTSPTRSIPRETPNDAPQAHARAAGGPVAAGRYGGGRERSGLPSTAARAL